MAASNKRLMKASEVPAFVDAITKAGCDICAIGHHGHVLGDVDLSPAEQDVVMQKVKKIEETYGDRDFLMLEIVAYLRSIGRYPGSPATHWSAKACDTLSVNLRKDTPATAYCGSRCWNKFDRCIFSRHERDPRSFASMTPSGASLPLPGRSEATAGKSNSWGDTMDDRETLGAIRLFNRTGSMFAGVTCSMRRSDPANAVGYT